MVEAYDRLLRRLPRRVKVVLTAVPASVPSPSSCCCWASCAMASSDWVRTMLLPSRISRLTMYRSTLEIKLGASRTLASSQMEARLIMDDELRSPMVAVVALVVAVVVVVVVVVLVAAVGAVVVVLPG